MNTAVEAQIPVGDPEQSTDLDTFAPAARLVVEYWTVTMDGQASCGSCDATLTAVTEAVEVIRPLAARVGITVEIQTRTVSTWAEALDHQILASPTIRAAGAELRPSHPDGTDTRIWEWRGADTASVTAEALLDLLIRATAARSRQLESYLAAGGPAPYLRQYLTRVPAQLTSATP